MSAKNTWKLHRWSTILLLPLVVYLFLKIIHLSTLSYQSILSEFSSLWGVGFILIFTVLGLIHMNILIGLGINPILRHSFSRKNESAGPDVHRRFFISLDPELIWYVPLVRIVDVEVQYLS